MSDAMGSKNTSKTFSTEFSTVRSSRKSQLFRLGPPRRKLSRKKWSRKCFFDCVRMPDGLQSKNTVFDQEKNECVRNGVRCVCIKLWI